MLGRGFAHQVNDAGLGVALAEERQDPGQLVVAVDARAVAVLVQEPVDRLGSDGALIVVGGGSDRLGAQPGQELVGADASLGAVEQLAHEHGSRAGVPDDKVHFGCSR